MSSLREASERAIRSDRLGDRSLGEGWKDGKGEVSNELFHCIEALIKKLINDFFIGCITLEFRAALFLEIRKALSQKL